MPALTELRRHTADLRTKILDSRGFDSSMILLVRGGILRSIGNFPDSLSQAILVAISLVGRLGVGGLVLLTVCYEYSTWHSPKRPPFCVKLCYHLLEPAWSAVNNKTCDPQSMQTYFEAMFFVIRILMLMFIFVFNNNKNNWFASYQFLARYHRRTSEPAEVLPEYIYLYIFTALHAGSNKW